MSSVQSGSRVKVANPAVIDASAAIKAALAADGFRVFEGGLVAPSLLWSEVSSGLRQLEWRQEITAEDANSATARLIAAGIQEISSATLVADAGSLARKLGWAKTYDAEYVVLAQRLDTVLITVDARLRRSVAHLVEIKGPTELVTETPTEQPEE